MADLINTLDARHSNIITNDFSYIPEGGSAKVGRVRMLPVLLNVTENGEYEVNAQQVGGFDGMSKVQVNVDVAGGGGGVDPDPTHWNVGDIVIWDEAGQKIVKDVKDAYTNEKYPADNFTPIGIVFLVEEDGSARMISLANMSCLTPDSGTEQLEGITWGGSGTDLDDMDNYPGVGTIDAAGIVTGSSGSAYVPVLSDLFVNADALDKVRGYGGTPHMPSPYNEDGTINEEYLKVSTVGSGPFYEWSRSNNGSTYYIYTDKPADQIDENTKLYGSSLDHNSFVVDYGFPQSGLVNIELGLITDTSIYTGGVAKFTTDFTSTGNTSTGSLLANSDLDGADNTTKILGHQSNEYSYNKITGGDTTHDGVQMYFWTRLNESDGKTYWFYTNANEDNLTNDTEIWTIGYSSSSFVNDYGTINSSNGTNWIQIGTIGDGTHITTGLTDFTTIFTRTSSGIIKYYWQRLNESDGKIYKLFTDSDPDNITDSTKIFIVGQSSSSFVFDYGSAMQYGGSSIFEIGTVGDSTKISGGAAGFLEHFTHIGDSDWRTAELVPNDGNNSNHFPAACTTWRFHTPGTEQGDWYLMAEGENGIVAANNGALGASLSKVAKLRPDVKVGGFGNNFFWSSTEYSSNYAWGCFYYNGYCGNGNYRSKNYGCVRAASLLPAL